jgi:hypothetical protein
VVGYQLQRKDLELQRHELRQNNVTQAEQQAAMARQADLLAEQLTLAREQTTLQYDIALALENTIIASGTPSRTEVSCVNLGATVYAVSLHLTCPPTFAEGTLKRFVRSHWQSGDKYSLSIRPQVASGSCVNLIARYQRADGRTRQTTYLFDPDSNLLLPMGSSDIGQSELFSSVSAE